MEPKQRGCGRGAGGEEGDIPPVTKIHCLLFLLFPSWVNPFTRSEEESVSEMVVDVVHSACKVDLSHLNSGTLHHVTSEMTPHSFTSWN